MSQIITYLLAEQPTHADEAILKYLEGKKSGVLPRPQTPKRRASSDGSARNALLRDRLYMGRKVQPVLENLMRRVVEEQPADVEGHFIKQLKASMAGKRRAKRESAAAAGRDASDKDESCNSPEVEEDITPVGGPSPRKWAPKKKQGSEKTTAMLLPSSSFQAPPAPSQGACDALFRMLDEDSSGSMKAAQVVGRLASLHACGVPIDSTARSFWSNVELSPSDGDAGGATTVLDRQRFFGTMVRVAETAEKWLPPGSARPKLSSVLPLATSQQMVAAQSPLASVSAPPPVAAATSAPKSPTKTPSSPCVLEVGAPVSVNYHKSGNFYSGKVSAVNTDNGTYDVTYDDGDSEKKVKPAMIVALSPEDGKPLPVVVASPAGSAAPSAQSLPVPTGPSVAVGSRVEVKYRGGTGNWYKGKVGSLNGGATFNVDYDDGEKEAGVKLEHLKLLDEATGKPVPCTGTAHDPSSAITVPAAAAFKVAGVKPTVAILGISGAGKSVLLKAMGGDPEPKPRPTTGFTQKKMGFGLPGGKQEVPVHWYDLPGSWTKKWDEYLAEAHAVVYVIDASAPEEGEVDPKKGTGGGFAHARSVFAECSVGRHVAGKPMLVLANKQDADGARASEAVAAALGLDDGGGEGASVKVVGGSAHPLMNGGEFDGGIEAGLEWLLGQCVVEFDELSTRVKEAEAEAEAERAREKVERARRVFTKVLKEKAFPPEGEEPMETFSEVDGFEFLAMELLIHDPQVEAKTRTAEEQWGLSEVAQQVCRLVGFQKMAMIMSADMINPEAKKNKTTRSWEEVVKYVKDRREEAGLPRDLP
jgi:signal recognition particle receptor subunit beta